MNINDQVHQISQKTVGAVSVAIGGSGTVLDFFVAWGAWVDVFLKFGNGFLVLGGIYLMFHKIFDKRRNRREED